MCRNSGKLSQNARFIRYIGQNVPEQQNEVERGEGMAAHRDDQDRIIALFRRYEQKMYHIAYAILHDSYQAEDAVMDAFVRLLERDYVIGDPASDETKSLIIRVIRSAAIDRYRKNMRESERQLFAEDPAAQQPVQAVPPDFAADDGAEALLNELPPRYRDVLRLRFVEEKTTAETAGALHISESAVRKRQERALRMMREKLARGKRKE